MAQFPDLSKIRAFAFDVDGVMTDGGLLGVLEGEFYRTYDAKDGFAVRMASMNGYHLAVITGGSSLSIRDRFKASGVPEDDIYLHSRDKMEDFLKFCDKHGILPENVMYFGDDVPDAEVIAACGVGVCPSDAVEEAKAVADYISPFPGGKGCIRECFEAVMKSQGHWNFDTSIYKKKF